MQTNIANDFYFITKLFNNPLWNTKAGVVSQTEFDVHKIEQQMSNCKCPKVICHPRMDAL